MIRPPPISTLFPYTTLFRSARFAEGGGNDRLAEPAIDGPFRRRVVRYTFLESKPRDCARAEIGLDHRWRWRARRRRRGSRVRRRGRHRVVRQLAHRAPRQLAIE